MSEPFRVGDQVELATQPPGRARLKVGEQGRVLIGEDGGLGWRLVTVDFRGELRPYQVHARHLRLVAAAEVVA